MKSQNININNFFYTEDYNSDELKDNIVLAVNKYCTDCQKKLTIDDIHKNDIGIFCNCGKQLSIRKIKIKKQYK